MILLLLLSAPPARAYRESDTLSVPPGKYSGLQAEASDAGDVMAQQLAPLGSPVDSFRRDEVAATATRAALVEMELGMTDGHYSTPPPSDNMFKNFFNQLLALCTKVEEGEHETEIDLSAPTSLELKLKRFPGNTVYTSNRDGDVFLTKDREGMIPLQPGPGFKWLLHIAVSGDPFISGSMIRAKATVWMQYEANAGYLTGYVTLFDGQGDAATPVIQVGAQQQTKAHKRARFEQPEHHDGDDSPQWIEWGALSERERLGKGNFGEVFKTTVDLADGRGPIPVAQKVPVGTDVAKQLLSREIRVMQDVAKVDEIKWQAVQLIYASQDPLTLAIEFAPYGDLESHISVFRRHPACFWRILQQVSWVFVNMPKLNHRDIKPQNMLLFPSKGGTEVNFKLADFGLASNNGERALAGTPFYLPPEARDQELVTRQADVFALGVTILNMVLGDCRPGVVNMKGCGSNRKCDWESGTRQIYLRVKPMIDNYIAAHPDRGGKAHLPELAKLIKLMTHPNPASRITFEKLGQLLSQYQQSLNTDLTCPVSLMKSK